MPGDRILLGPGPSLLPPEVSASLSQPMLGHMDPDLLPLLDEIVAKYRIDQDRIYLTGLSMGGFGAWALTAYAPDRFAAIVPICGGGEALSARRLTHLPVWVFHGAKDPIVPLKRSEEMVDALTKLKGDVKLTIYPEAGHDSWTAAYENPELYDWLLQQKRKPVTKNGL